MISNNDNFNKVSEEYRIIEILKKVKEKSIEKYHEWTDRCSGRNNSVQNQKIRETSYEFASFIAGLESEINKYVTDTITAEDYKISEPLRFLKNEIVDVIFPIDISKCKNREEYQNNMRKSKKLADLLEHFFMLAYNLGKGSQYLENEKETKIDETCFNEYMYNCRQRLMHAYDKGSRELMFLLNLAINNPNAMQEFKDRGIL